VKSLLSSYRCYFVNSKFFFSSIIFSIVCELTSLSKIWEGS
jgi:hypothetical protein